MTLAGAIAGEAFGPRGTVTQLLGPVMAAHAGDIVLGWSGAHLDQPDGVHAMRVSTRRLRSILTTGRPFLDRSVTEPVRDELGWLADVLGTARDAEVQQARIDEALDALVTERSDLDWEADHVRPALLAPLREQHAQAVDDMRAALESQRYADLAASLSTLVTDPPWSAKAEQHLEKAYRRRVRHHLRRLERRMPTASDVHVDPDARAAALHDARKAVKRARYAVEPLRPVHCKQAKRLTKRLKSLQSILGQLQDTVITRTYLHDLVVSRSQEVDATVGLVAGALIEREAIHAKDYEEAAMDAWHEVRDSKPLR